MFLLGKNHFSPLIALGIEIRWAETWPGLRCQRKQAGSVRKGDVLENAQVFQVKKMCFWLNRDYVRKQIEKKCIYEEKFSIKA